MAKKKNRNPKAQELKKNGKASTQVKKHETVAMAVVCSAAGLLVVVA